MRKLMIAVLALAVVFGFAACDNSNGTPDTNTAQAVVELIVTGTPEVFVGEAPEETDYTVQVRYYDGTIADAPAGSLEFNITAPAKASGIVDKAYETVPAGTVSYTSYNYELTGKVSANLSAIAHGIKALVVEGPDDPENYYQNATSTGRMFNGVQATADALFNKGAYTVSAVYEGADGEDKTEVLSADEYTVTYTDKTLGGTTATFAPISGLGGTFTQDSTDYEDKNTANIIIVEDTETGWTATAKENVTLVQGQASSGVQLSAVADVVATYASKTTATISTATGSWTAGTDASGKFNAASATMTVTYGTGANNTKTLDFDVVTPRVSDFKSATVTVNASDVASADKEIKIADVVVAVDWLNNISVADAFADGANISVDGKTGAETVIATVEAETEANTYIGTYLVRLTKYNEIVGNEYVMLTIEVGAGA